MFILKEDENIKKPNFDIEINDQIGEGVFSNFALISHSSSEFIVDFLKIMPGMPKGRVKSRVIVTPQHAKRLVKALHDNIKKYENSFGEIKDFESDIVQVNSFGPPGQA